MSEPRLMSNPGFWKRAMLGEKPHDLEASPPPHPLLNLRPLPRCQTPVPSRKLAPQRLQRRSPEPLRLPVSQHQLRLEIRQLMHMNAIDDLLLPPLTLRAFLVIHVISLAWFLKRRGRTS